MRSPGLVFRLARAGFVDNDLASPKEGSVDSLYGLLSVSIVDFDETEPTGPASRAVSDDAAALDLHKLAERLG